MSLPVAPKYSGWLRFNVEQVAMNGTRLSLFAPMQRLFGADSDKNGGGGFFLRSMAAGAACGAVGAVVGSPLFLVKARLQSQSTAHKLRNEDAGQFRWRLGLVRDSCKHLCC